VPPSLLDKKVRTYLKQSVALEQIWKTPITSEMLRKELERMTRQTQMPERLRELFAALGNDPALIQECLVRPVLVERLIRNFFDFDQRLHATSRREADSLRQRLVRGTLDLASDYPGRVVREYPTDETGPRPGSPQFDADPLPGELLSRSDRINSIDSGARRLRGVPKTPGEVGPVLEERDGFVFRVLLNQDAVGTRVASYSIAKERFEGWWKEVEPGLNEALIQPAASARDPLPAREASALTTGGGCLFNDSWNNQSLGDPPSARYQHTALWTGSLMLIWGGRGFDPWPVNTGSKYDPATDTWTRMSTIGAPSQRWNHVAVWTGSRMIVWGGVDFSTNHLMTGGIYDPVSDTWSITNSDIDIVWNYVNNVAVWAGGRMVVWNPGTDAGGRYNPASDSWEGVSPSVTLANRTGVSIISTGNSMIAWGGRMSGGPSYNTGARYDPATDTWTPLTTLNAPSARLNHTAVWSGSEMLIWGGSSDGIDTLASGGRYNPATDTWLPISTANAPSVERHNAVWAGGRMIVWRENQPPYQPPGIGGRYDPATDSWASISMVNAPFGFSNFSTVSTGDQMILWGGLLDAQTLDVTYFDTGGRYDPATDTWTPTATGSGPTGRYAHSAVWTGNVMVVWGGTDLVTDFDNGGRYDPAIDAWTPTSASGAPLGRYYFTILWTGSKMIVWGGARYDSATNTDLMLASGGRYDPLSDSWQPTTLSGAPSPRYVNSAVWTGSRMIIWGGYDGVGALATGAAYDPVNDAWSDTHPSGAPTARYNHSAIWTGSEMIVWGGRSGATRFNTGASYNLAAWLPIPTANAPAARNSQTAVWTGSEMVVWGGTDGTNRLDTGGRFNPSSGIWNATAMAGAPSGRLSHKAAWTGNEMIIWGGTEVGTEGVDTGGRYSPLGNSWLPTSITNAPRSRWGHDAVWTGNALLVWGGVSHETAPETDIFQYMNTGGQYCLCPMSPFYRDADADGFGDAASPLPACAAPPGYVNTPGDCNDSNAGLWGAPSEALSLSFIDGVTLAWSPPASPGAASVSYDVIRSVNPADFVSAASCTASDSPIASATDAQTPALGGRLHYLVRAQNGCPGGVGPLGNASNGTPRTALDCP
jgi:N-acetylneuraminic acid mutarotase